VKCSQKIGYGRSARGRSSKRDQALTRGRPTEAAKLCSSCLSPNDCSQLVFTKLKIVKHSQLTRHSLVTCSQLAWGRPTSGDVNPPDGSPPDFPGRKRRPAQSGAAVPGGRLFDVSY
jgi:hypothetical protein